MRATMRAMFKETKQKCARDQRGARKTEMLKTDKTQTKQKQTMSTSCHSLRGCAKKCNRKLHSQINVKDNAGL